MMAPKDGFHASKRKNNPCFFLIFFSPKETLQTSDFCVYFQKNVFRFQQSSSVLFLHKSNAHYRHSGAQTQNSGK